MITQLLESRLNLLDRATHDLRQPGDPVVLYGAGATARRVAAHLRTSGVAVHAVAADSPNGRTQFAGHPVVSLTDLAETGRSFRFVLGFVPVRADVATIAERLARRVPGTLVAPDFSGLSFGAASAEFVSGHADELSRFSDSLADDLSRRTLLGYLQARMTFDPSWLEGLYRGDQYFPSDLVTLGGDEHFVDAGAYDGDTIADFAARTKGIHGGVHAFEPDARNFAALERRIGALQLSRCQLHNSGTWEHSGTLTFRAAEERLSGIDADGDVTIRVEAIDDAVGDAPVTFIKMDVEGAELASLKGAARVIDRCRPRLAICLYHDPMDLVSIPAWVQHALPEARLFLRLHTRHSQELVLYALTR